MGVWQGVLTFVLAWRGGRWQSIVKGGRPEAEATFRGQCVFMRIKGGQTISGVCCTRCQLTIMAWRDREESPNFVFWDVDWVGHENERDWGCRWEWYGGYKWIWEIRGVTCLIWLGTPRVSVVTCQIASRTCHIGDGPLTRTQISLSPRFSEWFPPSLIIFLFHSQLYNQISTRSWVIPLYLCMQWWRVHTEYSICQIQHTPSTAYTKHCVHRVQHTLSTAYSAYWIISWSSVSHS